MKLVVGRIAFCAAMLACVGVAHAADAQAANDSQDTQALKQQLLDQQQQIKELRQLLLGQKQQIQDLQSAVSNSQSTPAQNTPAVKLPEDGQVASTTPVVPPAPAPAPLTPIPPAPPQENAVPVSPLQLKIGNTYITPVGFMDFTGIYRNTTSGSGIQTNFGSFPYANNANGLGGLSEYRLSPQNSRVGARFDSVYHGVSLLGYWESDFVGVLPSNPSVSSNSYSFRLRQFYIQAKKGMWEFMGGQSWSMLTPGRRGIDPLPSDLFYTQDVDVNYNVGLTWGRVPGFRVVLHPNDKIAFGVAAEESDQYIGGSGGGGTVVLPSAFASPYASQLDAGSGGIGVPNLHPDIIAKLAFDPSKHFHIELAGVERTFKVFNQPLNYSNTTSAGGAQLNLGFDVAPGLRLFTNNFYSDGGGRWLFGTVPDLIIRGDGSISPIHADSTLDGLEFTKGKSLLYGYYGGVYAGKDVATDPVTGKLIGYGYSGSSNSQNRSIQEITFGLTQTLFKDGGYGGMQLMFQYAYFTRNPWYLATGAPTSANQNAVWFNLRYLLPGSAPTLESR